METVKITERELLDAIALASRGDAPEDARTVAELCEETGRRGEAVRQALRKLQAQGRLVLHHREARNIAGRRVSLPAYTVLPAKRKK